MCADVSVPDQQGRDKVTPKEYAENLLFLSRAFAPNAWAVALNNQHIKNVIVPEIMNVLTKANGWVFPQTRRDVYKSGYSVYFVCSPSHPRCIKIGRTQNLARRTKKLGNELHPDREPLLPLAFLKCGSRFETMIIEKALHYHFDEHCIGGEWFNIEPVTKWIMIKLMIPQYNLEGGAS